MISETTMKAIKKYYRYYKSSYFHPKPHGLNNWAVKKMRQAVMLDNSGWPVHTIYNTGKIKTDKCKSLDERLDLSECAIEIFDDIHLEIKFMSNGTYIK